MAGSLEIDPKPSVIRDLPPAEGQRYKFYKVKGVKGLSVRVSDKGAKAWIYNAKYAGKAKPITIGEWPTWTFEKAKAEAERLESVRQVEKKDPSLAVVRPSQMVTLGQVLTGEVTRMENQGRSPNTIRSFKFLTQRLAEDHADLPINNFDAMFLKTYIEANFRDTPASGKMLIERLSYAFTLAMHPLSGMTFPPGYVNPAAGLWKFIDFKDTYHPKSYAMALEEEEMSKLLGAIEQAKEAYTSGVPIPTGFRDKVFPRIHMIGILAIEFLLYTGARPQDVQNLKWQHIQADGGSALIPTHKTANQTGKPRRIWLTLGAKVVLEQAKATAAKMGYKGDHVFPTPGGNRSDVEYISHPEYFAEVVGDIAGISKLKAHSLRSIYINWAIDNGVPLAVVSNNVEHSSVNTTQNHYIKNRISKLKLGAEQADDAIARIKAERGWLLQAA